MSRHNGLQKVGLKIFLTRSRTCMYVCVCAVGNLFFQLFNLDLIRWKLRQGHFSSALALEPLAVGLCAYVATRRAKVIENYRT